MNRKRLLLFTFPLVLGYSHAKNKINIIPQPVSLELTTGEYVISNTTSISYNNEESMKIAGQFVAKTAPPTGFKLKSKNGNDGNINFVIQTKSEPNLKKEGYSLHSGKGGITITANDQAGLFYGMQTLLQLLPKETGSKEKKDVKWAVPAVNIIDHPRFAWRGNKPDVSPHFFSVEDVKEYIDQMAGYKFNTLHWHLTDDNGWRIEIKSGLATKESPYAVKQKNAQRLESILLILQAQKIFI